MKRIASTTLCLLLATSLLPALGGCARTFVAEDLMSDLPADTLTERESERHLAVSDTPQPPKAGPAPEAQVPSTRNERIADFAVNLLQHSTPGDKNALVSPASALSALAMTANGAAGETRAQMENVLGLPVAELNDYLGGSAQTLEEQDGQPLKLANSLWIKDETFTLDGGETRRVRMMRSTEGTYLEDSDTTGFTKSYEGGRYSFVALLPSEGKSLQEYVTALSGVKLRALLDGATHETVYASIPQFEGDFSMELSKELAAMGMPDAFDPLRADFSDMGTFADSDLNLVVGSVVHKTYIAVDEHGTKAAVATFIGMNSAAASTEPAKPKTVTLDRPFVYLIVDHETDMPVFIGAVADTGR
ncbi:MAG: serpin family protein [Gordonibacter sp.]|uniref:serpin family protein n=1 Tax=Gordonibacter sp. TaxID=1968902 RepID=UPI002FC8AEEC